MEISLSSLRNHNIGMYPKASDHKNRTDSGWHLYSTRQQDKECLTHLLSSQTRETLGVKWKQIRMTKGFKKWIPCNPTPVRIMALHIEGPSDKSHEIHQQLAKWYSLSSKHFPDGTKLRLIPPFNTILSQDNKIKFTSLVAHQETSNKRLAYPTTWEFATNLLDKPHPDSGVPLCQVLMDILSTVYPDSPVFHTIDKSWRDDNWVPVKNRSVPLFGTIL